MEHGAALDVAAPHVKTAYKTVQIKARESAELIEMVPSCILAGKHPTSDPGEGETLA